ncbi:MAG: alpha/beta hydrolase [Bdellovibrionota bacterium]
MALPPFPAPRTISTNGIQMAVYEQGTGVPVVFSHGFPELAYSWRRQLPAVAVAGFRAIAPDQRGYGKTECPADVTAYDLEHLLGDLAGLLDALSIEKAVFCGHDWGGLIVWSMAQKYPDRVLGVIGVNTPFFPRAPMPPVQMMRAALGPTHYIVHFQEPGDADRRLAKDVRRTLTQLFRKGIKANGLAKQSGGRMQPQINLCALVEGPDVPGVPALNPEEMEIYVEAFTRTGFTGGINWYRNMDRNWEKTAELPQKITVPSLMITAEDDIALPPAFASGMKNFVPDLETHLIKDCGHWTQQEQPEELNRIMVDWLKRRFG